uniref:G-protein coupled receptors family 2 profile 2 domain-containing protein n=1 Tax=Clytia hemisphaerica TaxID=252671 RepID=A0A7M5TZ20_9CNID
FENIKFSRTRNWKDIYFMQWYLCIGYGIPFVITGIMVGIFHDQFKNAIECTVFEGDYLWILRGPVTFFILVNTIFFILILIKMRQQGVQRNSLQADSSQDCKTKHLSTKAFLVLVSLLGITFILGPFVTYSTVIAYAFVIMNGLTGVYFLLGHVILDANIIDQIKKRLKEFGSSSN